MTTPAGNREPPHIHPQVMPGAGILICKRVLCEDRDVASLVQLPTVRSSVVGSVPKPPRRYPYPQADGSSTFS